MTAQEFAAARQALGLSIEDVAAELNAPPHSVEAMESGRIRVPKRIARDLIWRVAYRQRQGVLEASGLAECETAKALERAALGQEPQSALRILEQLLAHSSGCPVCRARSEYLKLHAPVLPEYPMSAWMRGIGWLDQRIARMPRIVRPPEGDEGEGRRLGIFTAAALSILALGIAAFVMISGALAGRGNADWWRELAAVILIVPIGYFLGCFLAGWGYDATRRIRHRFVGYVVRGALAAAAIYGSIGLVMPVMEMDFDWSDWPGFVAGFAVFGALAGAGLWIIHRVRGKIPGSVA